MERAETTYRAVVERLRRFLRRECAQRLLARLSWIVAVALLAAVVLGTVEAALWLSPSVRRPVTFGFLAGFLGAVLCASLSALWPLLKRRESWAEVAYVAGERLPGVADRLGNAVAVYERARSGEAPTSPALAALSLRQVERETANVDFAALADHGPWRRARLVLAGALAVGLLGAILLPNGLGGAWMRLLHPNTAFVRGPVLSLEVEPGDVKLVRGDSLRVRCTIRGGLPRRVELEMSLAGGRDTEILEPSEGRDSSFVWDLGRVEKSITYRIRADAFLSPRYAVVVIEPPLVREMQVRVVYPSYTRLGARSLEPNVGDVTALVGSRLHVSARANKPLRSAQLVFDYGDTVSLQCDGERMKGLFSVHRDGEYWFEMLDQEGYRNREAVRYRITALRDAAPVVSIPVPGADVQLDESMTLPLVILAEDDFGFRSLSLHYRLRPAEPVPGATDTSWRTLALPVEDLNQDRLSVEYDWSLADLDLLPEDEVEYCAVVWDNDAITGPKEARSAIYRARYPSVEELYEEVRREQEAAFEDLLDVRERAQELRERVREIAREMLRDAEMNWERRQQVAGAAEEQQKLMEQLRTAEQRLDSAVQMMEKNQLVALETLEKYRQIQELVREIDSPQFRQALQRLQEAISRLDPKRVQEALRELQASQDELLESLDRTIELLKRLKLQQQLDELRTKAENLLQRQQIVNQALADTAGRTERLAGQQESLARDAENLEQGIRDLAEAMEQLQNRIPKGLDSARRFLDSTSVAQQMRRAMNFLREQKPTDALRMGNRAMRSLMQLASNLTSAQREMSGQEALEAMQEMQSVAWRALQLSQEQEKLWRQMQGDQNGEETLPDLAERQAELRQALNRIAEQLMRLSRRSFAVTPPMAQALGQAADRMERTISSLENRNPGQAKRSAFEAMDALNRLSLGAQDALRQAMGAGGQAGFEQWLQQLMGLSNQQQWLNQQTLQFGLGQNWSPEQQAALEQLAARQEALRRALEEILNRAAGQAGTAGRMDQVADDMKDVAEDLRKGRIRQETLEKQQRILTRLLDAQKSIRRQGYSRKRKAETAKRQLASHPSALPSDLGETENRWRRDLLRALKEGYAKDFRRLIESYFQAMARRGSEDR